MKIESGSLIVKIGANDVTVPLPKLPHDANVKVWAVPTRYQGNGLFVAVSLPNQPEEIPACDMADVEYLGELALVASDEAKLDVLKVEALNTINVSCANAITAGFISSALGSPHSYPSQQTDQQNLAANVLSSMLPGVAQAWTTKQICCDESGSWDYRPHTAAQIQQVGQDGKDAILAMRLRAQALRQQINAVTVETENAVEAVTQIVWS